ncbi:hypothetical protein UY3_04221 [Chelonia mydas]|uniref:Uncharacterized protein n=1 Tax=Chelonia mydas TaxID=8469 RepID=M7CCU0_CHEMY|nr:hypothetical protein UY3_04221 [Chelonia mydas]
MSQESDHYSNILNGDERGKSAFVQAGDCMLLSAAAPTKLRYKELVKTVNELKKIVKVKDVELLNMPEDFERIIKLHI